MTTLTLIPAYGRDYRTRREVETDLIAGRDFLISDVSCRWDGKPGNLEDFDNFGVDLLRIRWAGKHRVALFCVVEMIGRQEGEV